MLEMMVSHPNARATWTTVRIDREGNVERVLVVETDLATTSLESGFDEVAFSGLAGAVLDALKADASVDRADIVPIRKS